MYTHKYECTFKGDDCEQTVDALSFDAPFFAVFRPCDRLGPSGSLGGQIRVPETPFRDALRLRLPSDHRPMPKFRLAVLHLGRGGLNEVVPEVPPELPLENEWGSWLARQIHLAGQLPATQKVRQLLELLDVGKASRPAPRCRGT